MLGLALVFLVDLFDRRIKSVDDFETIYRLRSMSSIPQRLTEAATNRDRQAALEPFRILRNSLAYISVKPDIKIVMVTSAVPGEGKSTVSTGLARAAALAGQRVILVECDLRRPTFHQQFDLGGDPRGLTTALIGGVPVSELVRPVHSGLRALTVLPSGPTPPNAAEVFLSAEMRGVLRELSQLADLVVLDCPPLLPVADSHVLLDNPQVDACIVVGRAYHTTRDEARRARAVLDQHPLQSPGPGDQRPARHRRHVRLLRNARRAGQARPRDPSGLNTKDTWMASQTTVVTGGAGYIGAALCRELLQSGRSVRALDNLLHGQERDRGGARGRWRRGRPRRPARRVRYASA